MRCRRPPVTRAPTGRRGTGRLARGREAIGPGLRKRATGNVGERWRQGLERRQSVELGVHDGVRVVAREDRGADEELVEHTTRGVEVAALVERIATNLLRAHVR